MELVRRAAGRLTITVGLDFGTSTIKCVVNSRTEGATQSDRWICPVDGKDLFPSTVWVADERVYLGESPGSYAHAIRALKLCLRCPVLNLTGCKDCFRSSPLSAESLTWTLLSYCVKQIKQAILKKHGPAAQSLDWKRDVEWNMGVPLDNRQEEQLRASFLGLLWRAVHTGDRIRKDTRLREIDSLYKQALSVPVPPPEERNCFVYAEAHVAVNSFLLSRRRLEGGLYYICDVGAGTTDVSVFRYSPGIAKPIVFYGGASRPLGGESFVREIARRLLENQEDMATDVALQTADELIRSPIRLGKTVGPIVGLGTVLQVRVDPVTGHLAADRMESTPEYQACIQGTFGRPLFADLLSQIKDTLDKAIVRSFKKEKFWDRWQTSLHGAAMGGGTRIVGVKPRCLAEVSNGNPIDTFKPRIVEMDGEVVAKASPLHSIAIGLSIPDSSFYEAWDPSSVEELGPIHEHWKPNPANNAYDKDSI